MTPKRWYLFALALTFAASLHARPQTAAAGSTLLAAPQVTAHSVALTWTASATSTVKTYNVYRRTGANYGAALASGLTATNYTDASVTAGATYFYQVTAVDPALTPSESLPSNEVQAAIPSPPPALTLTTTSLPNGTVGINYPSVTLAASGGAPPYTFSGMNMPPGITLSESLLAGIPSAAGTFTPILTVRDSQAASAARSYSVTVATATTTGPQVGNRVSVIATANIRATAVNNGFGKLLGTEPAGALGTVTAVSTAVIPSTGGAVWIQVHFDSCVAAIPNCTGWMGSDNMRVVTTAPPVGITIAPTSTSLVEGQTRQFTATVSNSSNTGVAWSSTGGSVSTSGLYTAGNTPGAFRVTVTAAADPTKTAVATVTITAPAPTLAVDCSKLLDAFTATNIPSGTVLSVTGTAAGVPASCTIPLP